MLAAADGRIYFTVPKLFEASLCLRGAEKDEGWFFVNVEFLITIGGDLTGMQGRFHCSSLALLTGLILTICLPEFPREPKGVIRRHIADEADARLAYYLPAPEPEPIPGMPPPVARPTLPDGVTDTPLVRVFNFLRECLYRSSWTTADWYWLG